MLAVVLVAALPVAFAGDVKDWIEENIWIAPAVLVAVLLSAALLWRRS